MTELSVSLMDSGFKKSVTDNEWDVSAVDNWFNKPDIDNTFNEIDNEFKERTPGADFKLIYKTKTYHVHKSVLGQYEWFRAMLATGMQESLTGCLIGDDDDADLIAPILHWMYRRPYEEIAAEFLRSSKTTGVCDPAEWTEDLLWHLEIWIKADYFRLDDLMCDAIRAFRAEVRQYGFYRPQIVDVIQFLYDGPGHDGFDHRIAEVFAYDWDSVDSLVRKQLYEHKEFMLDVCEYGAWIACGWRAREDDGYRFCTWHTCCEKVDVEVKYEWLERLIKEGLDIDEEEFPGNFEALRCSYCKKCEHLLDFCDSFFRYEQTDRIGLWDMDIGIE